MFHEAAKNLGSNDIPGGFVCYHDGHKGTIIPHAIVIYEVAVHCANFSSSTSAGGQPHRVL